MAVVTGCVSWQERLVPTGQGSGPKMHCLQCSWVWERQRETGTKHPNFTECAFTGKSMRKLEGSFAYHIVKSLLPLGCYFTIYMDCASFRRVFQEDTTGSVCCVFVWPACHSFSLLICFCLFPYFSLSLYLSLSHYLWVCMCMCMFFFFDAQSIKYNKRKLIHDTFIIWHVFNQSLPPCFTTHGTEQMEPATLTQIHPPTHTRTQT